MTTKQTCQKQNKQINKKPEWKEITYSTLGDDSCYVGQIETHLLGSHVLSTHLISLEKMAEHKRTLGVLETGVQYCSMGDSSTTEGCVHAQGAGKCPYIMYGGGTNLL